jgi:GTP pyrophosphokinase
VRHWFNLQEGGRSSEAPARPKLVAVPPPPPPPRKAKGAANGGILVVGMDRLLTQIAKCCKPVPPDAIRGFVTRGRGVSIHRADCTSLARLAQGDAARLLDAQWGEGAGAYGVDMVVTATDRPGLLRDVGDALARERINVTAVRTQSRDDLAFMRFSFQVGDLAQLKRASTAVREVPGVLRVARG